MNPHPDSDALLLIDFINDFDFDGAHALVRPALAAAKATAKLKRRARAAGVPVVYVNDNFGHWCGDFQSIVAYCSAKSPASREIVRILLPESDDRIVVKPKNSAFFDTGLGTLLDQLGAKRLILTGLVTDNCILFTANDAHLREYELAIPSDCVAAKDARSGTRALKYMADNLHAATGAGRGVRFSGKRVRRE
jgi:nicotinamidase-related amidase